MAKLKSNKQTIQELMEMVESLLELTGTFERDPFANGEIAMGCCDAGALRGWLVINEAKANFSLLKEEAIAREQKNKWKRDKNQK